MACTVEQKQNLGLSDCNEFPDLMNGGIETDSDFVIPAATLASGAAAVLAYLQAALLSTTARIYYWPPFASFENISEEAVYQDSPLRYRRVRDGNYRFRFGISENLCLHKAMYTHRRTNGRWFPTFQSGYLMGTSLSNGDMAGFSIAMLNTEKLKFNDGSVASESPIVVALANNIELDKNGAMFDASTFISELYRIVDVNVTVVTITDAGDIDVLVATDCDETGVSGLLVADFTYLNAAGVAVTISTAVESSTVPGQYKLTQASDLFVDGTVNIRSAALLTVKAYESTGAAAVNIP